MVSKIFDVNSSLWLQLEEALTPLAENSSHYKVLHILPSMYLLPAALLTEVVVCAIEVATYACSFFSSQVSKDPHQDFSVVCKDSREWAKLGSLAEQITLGQDDPEFLLGPATCTYQDSGSVHCPNSQWAEWEKQCQPLENRSGSSANFFELYSTPWGRKEITDRLHKLGANSYRFSIEWSQIEPQEGQIDREKLQIYVNLCAHLRDEGIRPMVTLHHFSEPKWFHEKGSFEDERNISCFLRFSQIVYQNLTQNYKGKALVDLFCTINEPGVEAFSRYVRGAFSPGITFDFARGGKFLKGALKAHKVVYEALKQIVVPSKVDIGITHQRLSFQSTNPLLYPVQRYLTRFVNDVTLNYFKTGNFELKLPFLCHISEQGTKPGTDFMGVQYYARPVIGLTGSTSYHEPMTQMPFREDPEGLFEAITEVYDACHAPIIVTENGISTHDDTQRARYMERSLYATQRAREVIGRQNLRGFYPWSMADNCEWNDGMSPQKFGVYALVDAGNRKVLSGEPKGGIHPFIRVAKAWQTAHAPQGLPIAI